MKAIQGSAGTVPKETRRSSPKGFTSLSVNGLGNVNPAEWHPNDSSQALMMESFG